MNLLFRQEVIDARRRPAMGDILLARPLSLSTYCALAVFSIVIFGAFLVLGEYTRKERVDGRIVLSRGAARISSPIPGTVLKKLIQEGQQVSAGEEMYLISTERNTLRGGTQNAIGDEIFRRRERIDFEIRLQDKILKEQEQAAAKKIDGIDEQLISLKAEIGIQERRVLATENVLKRYSELLNNKFISALQFSEKEQELLDQEVKLKSLQRTASATRAELANQQSALRGLPLTTQTQVSNLQRSLFTLQQESLENEARREVSIRATQNGRATAALAEVGQSVTLNSPLVTILPSDAEFQANLYVPSKAIGFLSVGGSVKIRYQAFPYQKFGQHTGKIRAITQTAVPAQELQLGTNGADNLYRVVITLDSQYVTAYGKKIPLQDGMQLEADLLLDKRRLFEWILEPITSITGRM